MNTSQNRSSAKLYFGVITAILFIVTAFIWSLKIDSDRKTSYESAIQTCESNGNTWISNDDGIYSTDKFQCKTPKELCESKISLANENTLSDYYCDENNNVQTAANP